MARTVRGNRARKLAALRAQEKRAARHRSWMARIIVVCTLLGICMCSVALTYHDPSPPSVATMHTPAPHDYHRRGCAYWHAIERASVSVASQASALLRPWLQ